jgi:hypothetical protein
MICQACSSENPDGAVFCNNCGERMVVAYSDLNVGEFSPPDEPYYEVHGMGVKVSVSNDWLTSRFIPWTLLILAFGLILIIAGMTGGLAEEAVYPGLVLVFFSFLYVVLNMWVAHRYRKAGGPLRLPGSGDEMPHASEVMEVEDDTRKMDTAQSGTNASQSGKEQVLMRR